MSRLTISFLSILGFSALSSGAPADNVKFVHASRTTNGRQKWIPYKDTNSLQGIQKLPLKVIIHGWGGAHTNDFPQQLKNEYLKPAYPETINVILVDYAPLAKGTHSLPNARIVSQKVREFLSWWVAQGKADWDQIHLIGHSFGGLLVGQIGHRVKAQDGVTLPRVSAIEPGNFLFPKAPEEDKTSPNSAKFVDVIHTTSSGDKAGDVDFYPNGGGIQPGCRDGGCGHGIAANFYIESVLGSKKFVAKKCDNYQAYTKGQCNSNPTLEMGEHTRTDISPALYGNYYLKTNAKQPYAQS